MSKPDPERLNGPSWAGVPPGTTEIENSVLAAMLLCAFRYSLGRMTYQSFVTRTWLERYWRLLRPWQRQIHEDIRQAIKHGRAGWTCDIEEWEKVLALEIER